MALTQLDYFIVDYPNASNMKPFGPNDLVPLPPSRQIQLCQGDLTNVSSNDKSEFLVVSALPKKYTNCAHSLLGALNAKGVNVSSLTPIKDFRPAMPCWIADMPTNIPGLEYDYILIFEPEISGVPINVSAAHLTDHIFRAIHCFKGDKANNTSVSLPLVSCGTVPGSAGADKTIMMQMLFHSAIKFSSLYKFNIDNVKLVLHQSSPSLTKAFAKMKYNYLNLPYIKTLPDLTPKQAGTWPRTYNNYAIKSWNYAAKSPGVVWPDPITNYQVFGIRVYTTPYFHVMNGVLRNTDKYGLTDITTTDFAEVLPLYAVTSAGLMNLPSLKKQTFRGLNYDANGKIWNPFTVGTTVNILSYMSSAEPAGSIFSGDNVQITINAYNTKDISHYSKNPSEHEHLYDYNLNELVISNVDKITHVEITVDEIDPKYCSAGH